MRQINTTNDLLEEMRDNEEFRVDVIEALFPGNASLATIWAGQTALQHTQAAMLQNQSEMIGTQNDVLEIMAATLQEIREGREDLNSTLGGLSNDFGMFRGHYTSEALGRNRYRAIRPMLRALNIRLPDITAYETNEALKSIVVDNLAELTNARMDDDSIAEFMRVDQVLHIQNMRNRSQEFYLVIETSFTGRDYDIDRAILRATSKLDVYPCVAAVELHPDIDMACVIEDESEYLRSDHTKFVYWIRLAETALSPDSAR